MAEGGRRRDEPGAVQLSQALALPDLRSEALFAQRQELHRPLDQPRVVLEGPRRPAPIPPSTTTPPSPGCNSTWSSKGKPLRIGTDADWRCKASGRSILGTWSWNKMGGERVDARLEDPQLGRSRRPDDARLVSGDRRAGPADSGRCPEVSADARDQDHARRGLHRLDARRSRTATRLDFGTQSDRLAETADLRGLQSRAGNHHPLLRQEEPLCRPTTRSTASSLPDGRRRNSVPSSTTTGSAGRSSRGCPPHRRPEDAQALALAADWETCGGFECSNTLFNRMHEVNLWTLRVLSQSGFLSDCPHRERLGYGDGQVSIESCIMNFRMAPFYDKWATDWCDGADPETGYLPHTAPQYKSGGGGPAWGGCRAGADLAQLPLLRRPADRRAQLRRLPPPHRGDRGACQGWHCPRVRRPVGFHRRLGSARTRHGHAATGRRNPPRNCSTIVTGSICASNWRRWRTCWAARTRPAPAARNSTRLRPLVHAAFYDKERQLYVLDEQSYQLMPLMTGVVPDELRARPS